MWLPSCLSGNPPRHSLQKTTQNAHVKWHSHQITVIKPGSVQCCGHGSITFLNLQGKASVSIQKIISTHTD